MRVRGLGTQVRTVDAPSRCTRRPRELTGTHRHRTPSGSRPRRVRPGCHRPPEPRDAPLPAGPGRALHPVRTDRSPPARSRPCRAPAATLHRGPGPCGTRSLAGSRPAHREGQGRPLPARAAALPARLLIAVGLAGPVRRRHDHITLGLSRRRRRRHLTARGWAGPGRGGARAGRGGGLRRWGGTEPGLQGAPAEGPGGGIGRGRYREGGGTGTGGGRSLHRPRPLHRRAELGPHGPPARAGALWCRCRCRCRCR